MVEKEKYLYWLNADDLKLDKEVVFREMYSRIGLIFHIVQMNEYNIANIVAIEEFEKEKGRTFTEEDIERVRGKIDKKFEELSELTFGQLKKQVEKSIYLKGINIELLEKIVDYRNYLAHRCFKEKLLNNQLNTIEDADKFVDELNDYEVIVHDFNEWLLTIFKENKIKRICAVKEMVS